MSTIETTIHGIVFRDPEETMRAVVNYAIGYYGSAPGITARAAHEKLIDALEAMRAAQKDHANRRV